MMILPFAKSEPFPASAFERPQPSMDRFKPLLDPDNRPKNTGLPPGQMGVETAARVNAPARAPGTPDTSVSDRVAALGRSGAPAATAPAAPLGSVMPVMMPAGRFGEMPGADPLARGAAPGAASSLGGAVPVGRSRYDANRLAERLVRRGDPRGVQFLFGQAQQREGQAFQREQDIRQQAAMNQRDAVNFDQQRTMFGLQQEAMNERDAVNFDQQKTMFGLQQEAMNERDAVNFDQQQFMFGLQQEAQQQQYEQRRSDEVADRERGQIVGVEAMTLPDGGFVPVAIERGGGRRMAGGYMPAAKQDVPMTPEDIAAARAMGAEVSIQQGGTQVRLPGAASAPSKPVITWGEDPKTSQRVPFQQIVDPQTGEVKLRRVQIIDANGDGVDDRQQQQGAPVPPAGPAASKQLPGGGTVRRL